MGNFVLVGLLVLWPAFVLPMILGPIILHNSRGDSLGTLAGWFTLKPVLATPLWLVSLTTAAAWDLSIQDTALLGLIPGIGLTVFIVLTFGAAFKAESSLAWVLLGADAIRWLPTFAMGLMGLGPIPILFILALSLPNAYAIIALVIVRRRVRSRLAD